MRIDHLVETVEPKTIAQCSRPGPRRASLLCWNASVPGADVPVGIRAVGEHKPLPGPPPMSLERLSLGSIQRPGATEQDHIRVIARLGVRPVNDAIVLGMGVLGVVLVGDLGEKKDVGAACTHQCLPIRASDFEVVSARNATWSSTAAG